MSDSLTDLLVTDAALDVLAHREAPSGADLVLDPVLAELASWAAAVDELPVSPYPLPVMQPPMSNVRKGGWALTVTVALMVTSTGVAAAVSDDPMGPLSYVSHQFWKIGPHNSDKMPVWQLDGAMPISTVRGDVRGAGGGAARGGVGVGGAGSDGASGSAPDIRATTGSGDGIDPAGPGANGPGHGPGTTSGRGSGSSGSGSGSTGSGSGSGSGSSGPGSGQGGGSGSGGHGGGGGSGRPPSSGSGPGLHPTPPTVGGGQGPGNTGGWPGKPTDPLLPGQPIWPGQHHHKMGNPGYGRVPGTGTEAPPCRLDGPTVSGPWSGSSPALKPCHPKTVLPVTPHFVPRLLRGSSAPTPAPTPSKAVDASGSAATPHGLGVSGSSTPQGPTAHSRAKH